MAAEQLKLQLKELMIKYLNLLDTTPDDINVEEPFFVEGLGLDSIDAIELMVLLEREFGIKVEDPKEGKKILANINTMADYIEKNRTK